MRLTQVQDAVYVDEFGDVHKGSRYVTEVQVLWLHDKGETRLVDNGYEKYQAKVIESPSGRKWVRFENRVDYTGGYFWGAQEDVDRVQGRKWLDDEQLKKMRVVDRKGRPVK